MRWLTLAQQDVEDTPSWTTEAWGVSIRPYVEALSGPTGEFRFVEQPSGLSKPGSLVIATHVGHLPAVLRLTAEAVKAPVAPVDLVLAPSEPILVEVTGPRNEPYAGATVHHVGVPAEAPGFERLLQQEGVTDERGQVRLAPFSGEQVLWAEHMEWVSRPWQGPRPGRVRLKLEPTFTLEGTIQFSNRDQWEASYQGERRILISGRSGNLWRPLKRLLGVEEGRWGPVRLPLSGFSDYRVRLEGAPIAPVEVAFGAPPIGEHRRVDLVAEKQAELWIFVQDQSEEPICNASAVVWWGTTDMPTGPLHVEGKSREDGFIYVGTFPPGRVQFRVTAPGYALLEGDVEVPSPDGVAVTLKRGGRIAGRCTQEGDPVQDFEVIYWAEGSVRRFRSQSFFDRSDGAFEIDNLGQGSWSIHAASPSAPGGRPVVVDVTADQETRVELELPSAIMGRGRVVDAVTEAPVADARVQVYSSGGVARSFPWGAPVSSGPDGRFTLQAFVAGANYMTVEADGYAATEVEKNLSAHGELDWGDIRLHRHQPLTLVLLAVGEQQAFKASDLRVHGRIPAFQAAQTFDAAGMVVYPDAPPGDQELFLTYPDGAWTRLHLRLEPGEQWRFDHKVGGAQRLVVRVVAEAGLPLRYLPGVLVSGQEEGTGFVVRYRTCDEDVAVFEGIRAPNVQVWVFDADLQKVASRDVEFDGKDEVDVEVLVGGEEFVVRVVDPDGLPLSGAWVTIRSLDGSRVHGVDDTDAAGVASFFGLGDGQYLMDASHGIAGRCLGVPLDASLREFEFVLEADGALGLLAIDGDEPLPGVAARLETPDGVSLSDARQTDAAGRVRFEPLGEGRYRVGLRRADCWPAVVERALRAGEEASVPVQMRRLAELELKVLDGVGLPVTGLPLELRSVEFETEVGEWLEAARVSSSTGLVSDARGRILVGGLPRGRYAWSAALDGKESGGFFELGPGANELEVRLAR